MGESTPIVADRAKQPVPSPEPRRNGRSALGKIAGPPHNGLSHVLTVATKAA